MLHIKVHMHYYCVVNPHFDCVRNNFVINYLPSSSSGTFNTGLIFFFFYKVHFKLSCNRKTYWNALILTFKLISTTTIKWWGRCCMLLAVCLSFFLTVLFKQRPTHSGEPLCAEERRRGGASEWNLSQSWSTKSKQLWRSRVVLNVCTVGCV